MFASQLWDEDFGTSDDFIGVARLPLHEAGMLTIPAGQSVVRFLPALNLTQAEATEGLGLFEQTIEKLIA